MFEEELEHSITATIKSISKKEDLSFEFAQIKANFHEINQHNFYQNKIILPKIDQKNIKNNRFFSDLAALYLKYHDRKIHLNFHFREEQKQQLFDDLEKARLVILGSKNYLGIKLNLQKIIEAEIQEILEIWDIAMLLIRNSLDILENLKIVHFKQNVTDFLQNLTENLQNQTVFAQISYDFIKKIDKMVEKEDKNEENKENQPQNQQNRPKNSQNNENSDGKDEKSLKKEEKTEKNESLEAKIDKNDQKTSNSSKNGWISNIQNPQKGIEFVKEYQIFTTKYDKIIKASDLAAKSELEKLRENLDKKIKNLDKISHKLKAKLKRKLLSKKIILNEYNKEEGLVDPKKLTKLLTNPLKKDNYYQIKDNQYQDTVISILIDNSGSMRGNPITMSIMACEIIAQILEKFSIKIEILGFTTSNWHGGKSKKLWHMQGCPKNPGRLSDLCHIIYKNPNQSLKNAKINMALMLKEGILKENIDGEALLWAAKRLNSYSQNRKILMVISDGAPIDDSTIANNEKNILTNHLKRTILQLEKKSNIELTAIGIGHDVGNFYQNSLTIKNLEDLGDSMVEKICNLL